jgi:hypothetical protein
MAKTALTYPTRNEARAILKNLPSEKKPASFSLSDKLSGKVNDNNYVSQPPSINAVSMVALCYINKYKIWNGVVTVFTNALVDMFPDADALLEDKILTSVWEVNKGCSADVIDNYLIPFFGCSLEDALLKNNSDELQYKVIISNSGQTSFDRLWFNNSEKFIHPLIVAYIKLKNARGMKVSKADLTQIPIDYSIIGCYQHFNQMGFLNKSICADIVNTHTDAANDCLTSQSLSYEDILDAVMKDLQNPKQIKSAFDFIKQF